ncbi:hypothetical protein KUV80_15405 [Fictibacillus nanhaiensis]|uniref:hypothetical protein n=1 Tax=Fictibacillus nanhaiensis TaxID=742169 RepID=UPI001C9477AD|nr:hypothetical protein [Fictibacillus nanhaiensis]MBY6038061.1 hypothetical protein [Fictibacillus nanhaiensis]
MAKLVKQPLFLIGFIMMLTMFLGSFVYSHFHSEPPEKVQVLYNDEKELLGAAPFPPSTQFWLGTDRLGNDLFFKVMDGAKYTLGIAFAVAALRLLLSCIFSFFLQIMPMKIRVIFIEMVEGFKFVPVSLLAFIILSPVLIIFAWSFTNTQQITFSIAVLTFIAVPTLSVLITEEISEIKKMEFFEGVKLFGGGYFHILRKHILPFLLPRLAIMYGQHVVAVLILLAHMGFLELFIGGVDFITVDVSLGGEEVKESFQLMNEWSGLIGSTLYEFWASKWVLLAPVYGFALSILGTNFMVEGMKRSFSEHQPSSKQLKKKKNLISTSIEKKFVRLNS